VGILLEVAFLWREIFFASNRCPWISPTRNKCSLIVQNLLITYVVQIKNLNPYRIRSIIMNPQCENFVHLFFCHFIYLELRMKQITCFLPSLRKSSIFVLKAILSMRLKQLNTLYVEVEGFTEDVVLLKKRKID